jgi:hypothetical protein
MSGAVRHDDWTGLDIWQPFDTPAGHDAGSAVAEVAEKPEPFADWCRPADDDEGFFPLRIERRLLPPLVIDDRLALFELDALLTRLCNEAVGGE